MYRHKVQYYETDKMGITHHSNYIRWMEEARVDFLEKEGWPYQRFEEEDLISPVISVDCRYKKPTTFSDEVDIEVSVLEFNGVKLKIGYLMKVDGTTVCEGESMHCFLDKEGKPVKLSRDFPGFFEMLDQKVEKGT
ncbi:MAG: acyl-CoA thioesterase [Lachnospiraceae bacterium]|nr:acyl-CoA thioesterase [Lachnospiraceae bacterium]